MEILDDNLQSFFAKPLIGYGDIIYDQPKNESFCEKLESVQYKAALVITGAIQGTSREKIYQELGLGSLKSRRWYKRLTCMFKIMKEEAPDYLINLVPKCETNTKQETTVYPLSAAEQIVSSTLFFLLP